MGEEPQGPQFEMTPMQIGFAALKEMFDGAVAAGFNERQALILIANMAAGKADKE